MFESDDYDQILSQFDFPDIANLETRKIEKLKTSEESSHSLNQNIHSKTSSDVKENSPIIITNKSSNTNDIIKIVTNNNGLVKPNTVVSPKHIKRKIIDSHFDNKTKRKFPGPAGLLSGSLQESKDDSISHMELFSQDIDYTQNNLERGSFELPLWIRLLEDIKKWNINDIDTIKHIKQQALAGNLRRRKARTVTAFVEAVDRSATDPLIVLRDITGKIKGTLHRDAWSIFSPYIVAEYCALVLWKPTVLTRGSAFKKHYLNITLSNIYAIYSSAVLQEDPEVILPDDYTKDCEDNLTVIRNKESPENLGLNLSSNNNTSINENALLEGLDSIFSDDVF